MILMMSCMILLVQIMILPLYFQYIFFVQNPGREAIFLSFPALVSFFFVLFIHDLNKGRKEKAPRFGILSISYKWELVRSTPDGKNISSLNKNSFLLSAEIDEFENVP